jgi:heme exporter protein C
MQRTRPVLGLASHLLLGWACVLATLYLVCFHVPLREQKVLGNNYLIFFFHFPSAINCLNLFFFAGVLSAWQLRSRSPRADRAAAAAVEVGLLACTICLATGMIWADAAWGRPWVWHDKRLLSVAVMWLCYLAYMVFRANIENPEQRMRFSSVLGVIFAINVPLVWLSIRLFGQVNHPMEVELSDLSMKVTQWFGAGAFLILYLALWRLRWRSLDFKAGIERLDDELQAGRI